MKPFFFSVIIPTLNEEKYLPTLLSSLSKQTFRDFEVILVDAQSQDRTVTVFHRFQKLFPESRVLLSRLKSVGYQRNMGGRQAHGLYLVFLDADTDIEPTFLEELHIASLKYKFPFATTWIKPDSNKSNDQLMMLLANLGQELARALNRPFAGGYNTIVKREIFLKLNGFREDMKINEDTDLAIRAKKKNIEMTILKEPQVVASLRRFRSEGTLSVLRKYAKIQVMYMLKGPVAALFFDYPMGGHVHVKKRKKRIKLGELNTYLRAIKKLETKIINLLSE